MRTLFIVSVLAASLSGCPGCLEIKQDLGSIQDYCGAGIETSVVTSVLSSVASALFSGSYSPLLGNIEQNLIATGVKNVPGVIQCAVATVYGNSHPPAGAAIDPAAKAQHDHAAAWLKSNGKIVHVDGGK